MSAPSATWKPPPNATPCTAAITGTGSSRQTQQAYWARLATPWLRAPRPASLPATVDWARGPSAMRPKLPMSRPAQNARPSPDSTTARTPFSVISRSPAPTRPSNMALSRAFILSARFSRTSATPSWMSMVTRSFMARIPLVPRDIGRATLGEGKTIIRVRPARGFRHAGPVCPLGGISLESDRRDLQARQAARRQSQPRHQDLPGDRGGAGVAQELRLRNLRAPVLQPGPRRERVLRVAVPGRRADHRRGLRPPDRLVLRRTEDAAGAPASPDVPVGRTDRPWPVPGLLAAPRCGWRGPVRLALRDGHPDQHLDEPVRGAVDRAVRRVHRRLCRAHDHRHLALHRRVGDPHRVHLRHLRPHLPEHPRASGRAAQSRRLPSLRTGGRPCDGRGHPWD